MGTLGTDTLKSWHREGMEIVKIWSVNIEDFPMFLEIKRMSVVTRLSQLLGILIDELSRYSLRILLFLPTAKINLEILLLIYSDCSYSLSYESSSREKG